MRRKLLSLALATAVLGGSLAYALGPYTLWRPEAQINKFGYSPDIDTSEETVWTVGAAYTWPSAAEAIEVVSDEVGDTTAGMDVTCEGVDTNYQEKQEEVALDGTTAVDFTTNFLHIYRCWSSGSLEPTGDLTVRVDGGGATRAVIIAGINQTEMAVFTVPLGYTARITQVYGGVEKGDDVTLLLYTRKVGGIWRLKHRIASYQEALEHAFLPPLVLDEKEQVDLRALTSIANTPVSAGFDIELNRIAYYDASATKLADVPKAAQ